jgi:hypothetical protein
MADDAAAPDGELSDSAATEETSSATEPPTMPNMAQASAQRRESTRCCHQSRPARG